MPRKSEISIMEERKRKKPVILAASSCPTNLGIGGTTLNNWTFLK